MNHLRLASLLLLALTAVIVLPLVIDARALGFNQCRVDDIMIVQGDGASLPSGIPGYAVHIMNGCPYACNISDIHVTCGWYSSARLVDPSIFQRLDYDDCLVNGGNPLGPGEAVVFTYANTFSSPMTVSKAEFHC